MSTRTLCVKTTDYFTLRKDIPGGNMFSFSSSSGTILQYSTDLLKSLCEDPLWQWFVCSFTWTKEVRRKRPMWASIKHLWLENMHKLTQMVSLCSYCWCDEERRMQVLLANSRAFWLADACCTTMMCLIQQKRSHSRTWWESSQENNLEEDNGQLRFRELWWLLLYPVHLCNFWGNVSLFQGSKNVLTEAVFSFSKLACIVAIFENLTELVVMREVPSIVMKLAFYVLWESAPRTFFVTPLHFYGCSHAEVSVVVGNSRYPGYHRSMLVGERKQRCCVLHGGGEQRAGSQDTRGSHALWGGNNNGTEWLERQIWRNVTQEQNCEEDYIGVGRLDYSGMHSAS